MADGPRTKSPRSTLQSARAPSVFGPPGGGGSSLGGEGQVVASKVGVAGLGVAVGSSQILLSSLGPSGGMQSARLQLEKFHRPPQGDDDHPGTSVSSNGGPPLDPGGSGTVAVGGQGSLNLRGGARGHGSPVPPPPDPLSDPFCCAKSVDLHGRFTAVSMRRKRPSRFTICLFRIWVVSKMVLVGSVSIRKWSFAPCGVMGTRPEA